MAGPFLSRVWTALVFIALGMAGWEERGRAWKTFQWLQLLWARDGGTPVKPSRCPVSPPAMSNEITEVKVSFCPQTEQEPAEGVWDVAFQASMSHTEHKDWPLI